MIEISSADDLSLLRESVEVECKLAAGRDGKGEVPGSFWETYSAFANTSGGMVFLGVREKKGRFEVGGIEAVDRVRRDLFNTVNNPSKVSVNLLTDERVKEIEIEGKAVIQIEVPRATRKERPVYLKGNPLGGNTYRRQNEGDHALSDEEVKRMLAEQGEDARDARVLVHFDLDDLNGETLKVYRQVFANRTPDHVWNELENREFLNKIGGWRKDRETGEHGLTLAGLLMFGNHPAIQELLPNYLLDYQERPEPRKESRWIDRVTLDGTWSGNLYDFYRRVYAKLTTDLKVPFELKDGERQEDTPVHVALREALANVLVHSDFTDRASILVVKRPDMFGFRNPGLMRVPPEIALKGGEHDCRNRILHAMFRHVGVGEQAGSGLPKILHGWKVSHWRPPLLVEKTIPYNQTVLELRMVDLFPEDVMQGLKVRFGGDWERFDHLGRTALALAATEGTVNHARLSSVSDAHPVDLSKTLQGLTQGGFLVSTGGRGAVYHLPGEAIPTPEEIFGPAPPIPGSSSPNLEVSTPNLEVSTSHLELSSLHSDPSSSHSRASSSHLGENRDADGCLVSDRLKLPVIDDLSTLGPVLLGKLVEIAAEPRQKGRISQAKMTEVILKLCSDHFLTLRSLAGLVNRKPDALRNRYLSPLVRERKLALAFPKTPSHERQAYTSAPDLLH